jgi:hypothetical protein
MMETAQEFLIKKGFRKVHQPNKRYNLTVGELVEFLNEFAHKAMNNGTHWQDKIGHSNGSIIEKSQNESSHVSHHANG